MPTRTAQASRPTLILGVLALVHTRRMPPLVRLTDTKGATMADQAEAAEPESMWGALPDGALDRIMVVSPHFDDAALGTAHLLCSYPGSTVVTVCGGSAGVGMRSSG